MQSFTIVLDARVDQMLAELPSFDERGIARWKSLGPMTVAKFRAKSLENNLLYLDSSKFELQEWEDYYGKRHWGTVNKRTG